ncbi:helix-turn-helix domain-containing protein [Natrinema altunense]|uniref:Transcription regulator TrmB N-terminal domain-containing protein n=1 Tax=Natrinema altunense (strain JCM 12890 / CGMCC 1.3731 / AJ2) TaxID=1227494 RepID=L9ZFB1_NATA2|nr:helix-turn-helix domain-containing protein [Natrinema altunense]ELY85004.1 hypothetical protein C485_13585 [Natrinema altunense JCM 12890]
MDEDRERNARGQFTAEHDVTAEAIYETMEPLEPYTSREIADKLDVPRRTAYEFLTDLADSGRIRKKKTEPRRAIWIRPADAAE